MSVNLAENDPTATNMELADLVAGFNFAKRLNRGKCREYRSCRFRATCEPGQRAYEEEIRGIIPSHELQGYFSYHYIPYVRFPSLMSKAPPMSAEELTKMAREFLEDWKEHGPKIEEYFRKIKVIYPKDIDNKREK